jgi:hypothetical protein
MCPDANGVFPDLVLEMTGAHQEFLTMPCHPCGTQRNLESRVILSFSCIRLAPLLIFLSSSLPIHTHKSITVTLQLLLTVRYGITANYSNLAS